MKLCSFLAVLSLFVMSAFAADVNGKWKAEMQGRQGTQEVTFEFKVEGGSVTSCTITNTRGTQPLADCKLDGDNISFNQTMSRGDQTMKIVYKGKVSGDEIKFTREMQGGSGKGGQAREFTAKRVM
jgi:hypothetical protein